MSAIDFLILIGTVSLTILSGITYFIASTNGYRRYGREALFVAASLYATLVGIRIGRDELGLITFAQSFQVASVAYTASALILMQLVFTIRDTKGNP